MVDDADASLPNCLCALEEEDLRHRFLVLYGIQPPRRLARDLFVPGDRAPHSGNGARRPQPAASLAAFRLSLLEEPIPRPGQVKIFSKCGPLIFASEDSAPL